MVESTTNPIQSQRRDSHDDSSDSQDPGTTSASTSQSAAIVKHATVVENPTSAQDQNSHNHTGNTTSNGRQKSGQQVGFKRHRAGRRRAGETRLRESQSLNRITEVQESEIPLTSTAAHNIQQPITSKSTNEKLSTGGGNNKKGFSARLLNFGFRKNDNNTNASRIPAQAIASDEEVEIALGVELAKALKVTESKNSSATKKLKMLGRYFQVKKIRLNQYRH